MHTDALCSIVFLSLYLRVDLLIYSAARVFNPLKGKDVNWLHLAIQV